MPWTMSTATAAAQLLPWESHGEDLRAKYDVARSAADAAPLTTNGRGATHHDGLAVGLHDHLCIPELIQKLAAHGSGPSCGTTLAHMPVLKP